MPGLAISKFLTRVAWKLHERSTASAAPVRVVWSRPVGEVARGGIDADQRDLTEGSFGGLVRRGGKSFVALLKVLLQ